MPYRDRLRGILYAAMIAAVYSHFAYAETLKPEEVEFFESKIRPVLVDHCYKCHGGSAEKVKGGLNLTFRDGVRNGSAVVPGDIDSSAIVRALRYTDPDLQMPPTGRLSEEIVRDFETWVAMGAPDPRDAKLDPKALAEETSWEATVERRKSWWSYRPIASVQPPEVGDRAWSNNAIDRFVYARMIKEEVAPSELADAQTIARRLSYVLTGLPPSQEDIARFTFRASMDLQGAVDDMADRLLASPRFGERWARHWMDWIRYAESHGSEGDPRIPYASRYRDYLIRALNDDVPYDQLVREHLAGDLMGSPRVNEEMGIVESAIGAAQYRFVLHGFGPTDALLEQVRFTDDQIDVISKAFMATTVSCARCHDHKFDPVSQRDFYALYGVMASCRPATIVVDTPERQTMNRDGMKAKKEEIRSLLAGLWETEIDQLAQRLNQPNDALQNAINNATTLMDPLHAWQRLGKATGSAVELGWRDIEADWARARDAHKRNSQVEYDRAWRLTETDGWVTYGNGVMDGASGAGAFAIEPGGDRILTGIYPAGVYSHLLSSKHNAVVSSPRFQLDQKQFYVRVAGGGDSVARYVIQNYPRSGTVYPVPRLNDGQWRWQRWDMTYWLGEMAYIELSTAMDQPVETNTGRTRSWFGITDAVAVGEGQAPPQDSAVDVVAPFFDVGGPVKKTDELVERYKKSIAACVQAWREGSITDGQARYLDQLVRAGLLTNALGASDALDAAVNAYRELEAAVPVPMRVPGVLEAEAFDQPLYERGDHKKPGQAIPRGFLEVIEDEPFEAEDAGRLQLAESIMRADNPLTARVITNRLWHHVFGAGIVTTPDDFGAMGAEPSHLELLDFLAARMRDDGWSMKDAIRHMVTSRTFRQSSLPSASAADRDPGNALLSHAHIRRLEAEAIRDTMLAVSGRLNLDAPDGSVDGRSDRRSIYVRVIRNALDPLLATFDAPTPVSTKGRRDATNVPAQALTLMNDSFVRGLAHSLAERVTQDEALDDRGRATELFTAAITRKPTALELDTMLAFIEATKNRPSGSEIDPNLQPEIDRLSSELDDISKQMNQRIEHAIQMDAKVADLSESEQKKKFCGDLLAKQAKTRSELDYFEMLAGPPQPWSELAHSLFNMKEFIYLD